MIFLRIKECGITPELFPERHSLQNGGHRHRGGGGGRSDEIHGDCPLTQVLCTDVQRGLIEEGVEHWGEGGGVAEAAKRDVSTYPDRLE